MRYNNYSKTWMHILHLTHLCTTTAVINNQIHKLLKQIKISFLFCSVKAGRSIILTRLLFQRFNNYKNRTVFTSFCVVNLIAVCVFYLTYFYYFIIQIFLQLMGFKVFVNYKLFHTGSNLQITDHLLWFIAHLIT